MKYSQLQYEEQNLELFTQNMPRNSVHFITGLILF